MKIKYSKLAATIIFKWEIKNFEKIIKKLKSYVIQKPNIKCLNS